MSDLSERRRRAAEASGGTSEEAIYTALTDKLRELGAHGDVLDFGAGTGALTSRLVETGLFDSVSGADMMARPPELPPGILWLAQDLNDPLEVSAASFDVVVAAEVIEHLENPRAVAREWFRLLRPGGVVLLSTPNNESIRALVALLVRGHFVAFGDASYPAHITALLRKDIVRVLSEAGFVGPEFGCTARGGIPGWPSATWQQLSANLLRGPRWSDTLIAWAFTPPHAVSSA